MTFVLASQADGGTISSPIASTFKVAGKAPLLTTEGWTRFADGVVL